MLVSWCADGLSVQLPAASDEPHEKDSTDSTVGEPEPFVEPPPDLQSLGLIEGICKAPFQASESTVLIGEGKISASAEPWTCGSCGFKNEVSPSICVLCDGVRTN